MQSRWNDRDARAAVEAHAKSGVPEDVALRIYTTRLLGSDPLLVLHGGGNTSVKTRMTDLLGTSHDVLRVKGSGWDMGTIEAAGLPAVKLGPIRELRARATLSDEEMVNFQRLNLLDASAPTRPWRRCCTHSSHISTSIILMPPRYSVWWTKPTAGS